MPRSKRSLAGRRRSFAWLVVALVVATVGVLALATPSENSPEGPASQRSKGPSHASTAPSSADETSPAAWLAWISGGFPDGFREAASDLPGADRTVVVAGDTRWMTVSHDADGTVVDRPDPPLAIPIDAFAVDPGEYAPFLPPVWRADVTSALRRGEGVISTRSAELRRIEPGGSMTFGNITITIAVVAPDEAIGWSELLVSRKVGQRLGIADDRYLLADMRPATTAARFARAIEGLLPPGTPLRALAPGSTKYVRVASGVNPPVMMKQFFGEFAAAPRSDDPAFLTEDPDWVDEHIATRTVPLLGDVTCNVKLFPPLIGALRDVQRAGLGDEIHVYSGCWAARTVARSPTAPPSQHAYGAAIDINAPENPYGATPTMDPRIVRIFERWGFLWGGEFLIPDGMHFEYGRPRATTVQEAA